jgi:thioredoxin 1
MMSPTVDAVAEQYAGSVRVVKLDVDENPGVAQRYGIKGIPTLLLFRQGKEAERVVGAVSEDVLSHMVEKYCGEAV